MSVHGDTLYVFCGFILEGHTEQAVPESELGDRLSGSEKGVIDLLTIEDRHNYAASDVNSVFALDFTTRYAPGIDWTLKVNLSLMMVPYDKTRVNILPQTMKPFPDNV